MNDEKEYDISTLLKAINGSSIIGDMIFDPTDYAVKVNTGNSWSTVDANISKIEPHTLEIREGSIKIGSLVMEVEQFETCIRHLLEMTKRDKPEEFI
jgi:hypothetical protein